MKIEQAISIFEGNGGSDVPSAIALALIALNEKAEREKGCKYCRTDAEGYSMQLPKEANTTGLFIMEMFVPEHKFMLCGRSERHPIKTQIFTCPICGRKLERGTSNEY